MKFATHWPQAPDRPELDDESVHVWGASIESLVSDEVAATRLLSSDELARAERFRFAEHARTFRLCRALLRTVLARSTGTPAAHLRFQYNEHGKPQLAGPPSDHVEFNLSHSGDVVLIAVARHRAVGIDVEGIRSIIDAEAIARNYFSSAEVDAWLALDEAERSAVFFRCWTRKESLVKAIGRGLSIALDQFSVSLAAGGEVAWQSVTLPVHEWRIVDLELAPHYAAALSAEAGVFRVERFAALPGFT
jgi:4'-phosphopantetheinyl transferase